MVTGQFLEDKVALVTGGGSGIGRSTVLAFAKAGASVVVADRNAEMGAETVGLVESAGGRAIFITVDISVPEQVEAMVARTVETYGRLDCACNGAGMGYPETEVHAVPEEGWDRVVAVNVTGTWLCMKAELIQMLSQGSGAIVNIASVMGLQGSRGQGVYSTTKHAVVGMTRTAALEYAADHIRINAVCPSVIDTPFFDPPLTRQLRAILTAGVPAKRLGQPEEVASAITWLCSDAASYITGIAMPVDGGVMVQ